MLAVLLEPPMTLLSDKDYHVIEGNESDNISTVAKVV